MRSQNSVHILYQFVLVATITATASLGQTPAPSVKLAMLSDQLSHPTAFAATPARTSQLFVCEQEGRIRILEKGKLQPQPFLDISTEIIKKSGYDERGLLGLAFHPNYAKNGKFYVYCSTPTTDKKGVDNEEEVREYTVSAKDPNAADKATMRVVLKVDDPESNHNGGDLKFGPDGFLYISIGDGGGQNDKHGTIGNAQNMSSLMGKILRIDINQQPYGIPKDNPFVGKESSGQPIRPEIFAYGFRNPWRISFDRQTGALFTGDVGQDQFEEIDIVEKGGNYGWRVREGEHEHNESDPDPKNWINPISEYPHAEGISVTGGFRYRGKAIPALAGKYVFADWTGPIWQLTEAANKKWTREKLPISRTAGYWHVYSFGEDNDGELYMLTVTLDSGKGVLYKLVP